MAEMSIPVVSVKRSNLFDVLASSHEEASKRDDDLKQNYNSICETIKLLRDSYMEFCEDEEEFNSLILPIEKDPESYANGTKKTRTILKKYAQALVDKLELEQQMDAEAEAKRDINLTPQQVKADMKCYVSMCEKKITKQQKRCELLEKQVEQLTDVVKLLVTHPLFDSDFSRDSYIDSNGFHHILRVPISLLTHSIEKNMPSVQDFLLEQGLECEGSIQDYIITSNTKYNINSLHYACYKNDIVCVEKMLKCGSDINSSSILIKDPINWNKHHPLLSVLEIAAMNGSFEMTEFLVKKGATIGTTSYRVPNGPDGDLVAGYLQTHGSKPVTRF